MPEAPWAIGVDLGGTKVEVASVDASGRVLRRVRRPTEVAAGPAAVELEVTAAVHRLWARGQGAPPVGVGVGMAGQIDPATGFVRFSPNLDWHDVPLGSDLQQAVGLPVVVTNDVRAAAWGEWLHGAGQRCSDRVCVFVGTGVGGGMVSGCSNASGEVGHIIVDLSGPPCTCGNWGCLEALAGGWAIARRAREAITTDTVAGTALLQMAGGRPDAVTAKIVGEAAHSDDPLAQDLFAAVAQALIAGATSLVNAFNPCRLIPGGGIIEGMPELVSRVDEELHRRALEARAAQGLPLDRSASATSFFLSRIDVLVDPMLEQKMREKGSEAALAEALHGQVTIASAKMAYQMYMDEKTMKKATAITCMFLDIGDVLLTNGWGHQSRALAAKAFDLDLDEMEDRHHLTFDTYEVGKLTLEEYLNQTVFHEERAFTRDQFRDFMFAQSQPYPEMIELVRDLKAQHGLKIAVVNNEARELNAYRIREFRLDEFVDLFVSSCFVHVRKPDVDIFRLALDIAQAPAEQVVYIENTPMFVQIAEGLGIRSILHVDYRSTCAKVAAFGLQNEEAKT